jgi:hypothetical protein
MGPCLTRQGGEGREGKISSAPPLHNLPLHHWAWGCIRTCWARNTLFGWRLGQVVAVCCFISCGTFVRTSWGRCRCAVLPVVTDSYSLNSSASVCIRLLSIVCRPVIFVYFWYLRFHPFAVNNYPFIISFSII